MQGGSDLMGIYFDMALDCADDAGERLEWETNEDGCWVFLTGRPHAWPPSRDLEGAAFAFCQREFTPTDAPDGPKAAA